ncbi:MAG: urease accessory protein UreE [Alphaproteobacteria bacterium]|nr:urease accessory protein UreE [Alphaproteobacteria bacterium]
MWLSPALPRAQTVLASGSWPAEASDDRITLDFDARHRRRVRMTSDGGLAFLLDLADARLLRDGDCLSLDNGKRVRVCAAPEKLLEVRCTTPEELARTAWHLGNRHLSVQVLGQTLRLRDDYVIADMLRHLGADLRIVEAPFDPETGAYAGHGHSHG